MGELSDKKGPGGRPTKYKPEYVEQARKLCILGATEEAMADFFEVTTTTLDNWKKAHPEFFGALKAGKLVADAEVATKLYNRAMGYSHPETKVFNDQGKILTHDIEKHLPPDTTAAIFWLKNRQPAMWRDKQHVECKLTDDFDSLLGQANDED